ncbi:hypothetical protein Goshw_021548 [Gossypium schwendimanii]|uniref:Uncharacterized protein n=1 Tax=Gossypium schwendimanii TaxID=34291 RepID=A0A7J9MD03_GOSSC|nr:hypothetical protein [Gossypium schwendimanii]
MGIGIPSNIENNPRREGNEQVKTIALRLGKILDSTNNPTQKENTKLVLTKIPFLSRLKDKQKHDKAEFNEGFKEIFGKKCYEIPLNFPNLNLGRVYSVVDKGRKGRFREWDKWSKELFYVTPKDNAIIPVVQEFYASFRDQESKRPYDAIWETDSMYTQYVELQRKQIKDWNQYRKEKMDVPELVKKKTPLTSRRGLEGRNILDLEWVIRWMQEMGLVGQEFSRQNGMRIPELPPNKDDPMQFHNSPRSKEVRKKEVSDDNEEEEEYME